IQFGRRLIVLPCANCDRPVRQSRWDLWKARSCLLHPPQFAKAASALVLISSGNHGGGTRVFGNTMCKKFTRSKRITFGGRFDFIGSSPRFNASFSEPSPTAAPTSPKIAADRAPVFKSITIAQSPFRVFNAGFESRGKLLTKTT